MKILNLKVDIISIVFDQTYKILRFVVIDNGLVRLESVVDPNALCVLSDNLSVLRGEKQKHLTTKDTKENTKDHKEKHSNK